MSHGLISLKNSSNGSSKASAQAPTSAAFALYAVLGAPQLRRSTLQASSFRSLSPPPTKLPTQTTTALTSISPNGKIRVLNPVSDKKIKIRPETPLPKVLNTLDFRLFEVCKVYHLSYENPSKSHNYVKKVIFSDGFGDYEFVVMAIDENDKLWFIKSGDQKRIPAPHVYRVFRDVVVYKGMFHAVDFWSGTYVFESWDKMTWITDTNHFYAASKKCLLELFDGELCMVEVATDKDKRLCKCDDPEIGCQCRFPRTKIKHTAVDIMFSRINKQRKEWVRVTDQLDLDRIVFVGDDCSFSFPAKEFTGCKNTRVFYADRFINFKTEEEKKRAHCHDDFGEDDWVCNYWECDCYSSSSDDNDSVVPLDMFEPSEDVKVKFRGLHGHNVGVWDRESGNIGSVLKFPEYAGIFWPPPSWLNC